MWKGRGEHTRKKNDQIISDLLKQRNLIQIIGRGGYFCDLVNKMHHHY